MCTTSEYVYSSSSSPQLALCCLCNPGQLACHGSPQKRENIFHSSSSKKRNHVPPRPLPVASPLGLSVTLSGRSPLSGRRASCSPTLCAEQPHSATLCAGQLELSNACCCCGGTGRLPPLALGRGTSPPAIRGGQSRTGGNKRDLACHLLFISGRPSPENAMRA